VQMRATEMVQVTLLSTRRHRDEALWSIRSLPILLWFPRRWQSAWISKSEWKQIKSLLGKTQLALYYAWGEDYNDNPKKGGGVSWIHQGW
jgi:hypothetical protein